MRLFLKSRSSLQSKIAFAMWVMTAISTVAAALLAGSLLIRSHRESIRQQLQAASTALISLGISDFAELKDFTTMSKFIEDALKMEKVDKFVRIYGSNRRLIFTTVGMDYDRFPNSLEERITKPVFLTLEGEQRTYETLVIPYGKPTSRFLQVGIPLPRYSEILRALWWQGILFLGILIGLSIALSRWLAERLLAPVGIVAQHLSKMDPDKIDQWRPIELEDPSQYLEAITSGINSLSERTREAVVKLRRMSRYVAHEMRTPLTILRGEAETVLVKRARNEEDLERVLKSSLEEIERMSEIVDTVLRVGTLRVGTREVDDRWESIDLSDWISKNRPQWEKTIGGPITIEASVSEQIQTQPRLLYRLIDNLIRNVRDHAASSCRMLVTSRAGTPILELKDEGPGLPAILAENLNRGTLSSPEIGIGLDLCHRISEILGLSLSFANSSSGGLAVTISFPERVLALSRSQTESDRLAAQG